MAAAQELFYAKGIHAVSVDDIKFRAGITKATFYNTFPSKQALVTAYLGARDASSRRWLTGSAVQSSRKSGEPLVRIFDVLDEWFSSPAFAGCPFTNALGEHGAYRNEILAATERHKAAILAWLVDHARNAEAIGPVELAEQLMLLYDGAIVAASSRFDRSAARRARRVAGRLVAEHGIVLDLANSESAEGERGA